MGRAAAERVTLQVVVYSNQGRSVRLVVDRTFDIVEGALIVHSYSRCEGILGSAVIQGHVTDLLDVRRIVRAVDPILCEQGEAA